MIIGNGTEIQSVFYNGVDLDRVIYNGVVVFEKNTFDPELELIDFDYYKHKSYYILTGWKGTYQGEPNVMCVIPNSSRIKLRNDEKAFIVSKKDYLAQIDKAFKIKMEAINFKDEDFEKLNIQITDNNNIIKYNNFELEKIDSCTTQIILNMTGIKLGKTSINLIASIDKVKISETINIEVLELLPSSYEVVSVDGYYPFTLNADGYYESTNQGLSSSTALCKVNIVNNTGAKIYIDCLQTSESYYDYGIFSYPNIDFNPYEPYVSLQGNWTEDPENPYVISYDPIEGESWIYIAYLKDGGGDNGQDSLQFKIRFEE
jgi:hypothetical protein